jgi:hypothetical protein
MESEQNQRPQFGGQSGRGQAEQTRAKTNHAVRKGASATNKTQNQPEPSAPPQVPSPYNISQLLHQLVACQERGLEPAGARLVLVGFGSCFVPLAPFLTACLVLFRLPLPDCAVLYGHRGRAPCPILASFLKALIRSVTYCFACLTLSSTLIPRARHDAIAADKVQPEP